MSKAIVFVSLAQAINARDYIDGKFGLPADGTDVGGGVHVAPALARTLHQFPHALHPVADGQVAVLIPNAFVNHPKLLEALTDRGLTIVDLDGTWAGAQLGTG